MRARQVVFVALLLASSAHGYVHVVKTGETLAEIGMAAYNDPRGEAILVGANALDTKGGTLVSAGFRLEVPAPSYTRAVSGDTWPSLAEKWLGHKDRAGVLASVNDMKPWIPPEAGRQIKVPPVVSHIAGPSEDIGTIARRYWGDAKKSWEINSYNHREGISVSVGEVVLVPIYDLNLTAAGREKARASGLSVLSEASGTTYESQMRADIDVPALLHSLKQGRYIEVVARGNRLLGTEGLSREQLFSVHKALVEAYVALDVGDSAKDSCTAWKGYAKDEPIDEKWVSPKIRKACGF